MKKPSFVGRKEELAQLNLFLKKKTASLIVIKGRRRIGKSRLVEKFAEHKTFYQFAGLPPGEGVTSQDQRDEFARRLREQFGIPEFKTEDWGALFALLGRETISGQVIILFDEISWMADGDETFLGKLKNAWEQHFKKNNQLILIFCSSISMWIEENILGSTGYFGRVSWDMQLDPLPLKDCSTMLDQQGFKTSAHEKFKILSVTGGVPWYIEQMQGQLSADDNIKRQCFTKGGVLVNDFDRIFHDLFEKRDEIYKKLIVAIANSPLDYNNIALKTRYPKSGRLSAYLQNLVKAGFLSKDQNWSLQTGKEVELYKYRLSDNYLRFYLRYIAPRKNQIDAKRFNQTALSSLPEWDTIMGLQFENLVANNRHELYTLLNINPNDILYDNPFFQRKTLRQAGCQIDFLIQTKFKTIYVCEIKFSSSPISKKVIQTVEQKIQRITLPKGFACLPVLIHVNGITEQVNAADYFHTIVDFSELIKS